MAHDTSEKNQGAVEQGGTEPFDIVFYNRSVELGGVPTNPDGYSPGAGPNYTDPSPYVTTEIKIYDSSTATFVTPDASYVPPTTGNLRYNGSTGHFLSDVTAPSNVTLSANLKSTESWAIVWTTTINGRTVTDEATAELFEVVAAGATTHGSPLYCKPKDVADFMTSGRFNFDSNSPQTAEMVEKWIRVAMDQIDGVCRRSWRVQSAKDEVKNIQRGYSWGDYYAAAKLKYGQYGVRDVTKVEVWDGAKWWNITNKEGRSVDGLWYLEGTTLYLRYTRFPYHHRNSLRVTYTYGEHDPPWNIKMATIMLTAWMILQSEDYTLLFPEGSEHMRISEKSQEWYQKAHDFMNPERRGINWA